MSLLCVHPILIANPTLKVLLSHFIFLWGWHLCKADVTHKTMLELLQLLWLMYRDIIDQKVELRLSSGLYYPNFWIAQLFYLQASIVDQEFFAGIIFAC